MTNEHFMQQAIEIAREGMRKGQSPFGACVVKNGAVISCAHNQVWDTTDITAHAEVQAIRAACQKLQTIHLSGCTIYSTCEPCPMCFSAIHWARIDKIVFGARIRDANVAGFNELAISNEQMQQLGKSTVKIEADFCAAETRRLFAEWQELPGKKAY